MTFSFLKNLFQKSLKQRLGKSNIQARLGRPAGALARGAMGGRGLAMGQRGLPRGAMRGGRGARALLRGGVPLRGQYRGHAEFLLRHALLDSPTAILRLET